METSLSASPTSGVSCMVRDSSGAPQTIFRGSRGNQAGLWGFVLRNLTKALTWRCDLDQNGMNLASWAWLRINCTVTKC